MCDRARTMSIRALRRLSETELSGLRIALDTVEATEAFIIARLSGMRRAMVKEQRARRMLGLYGPGDYGMAYQNVLEVTRMLTWAREETSSTLESGRIPRP